MNKLLKEIIKPQMMLVVAVSGSFIGWLLPASTVRTKGFQVREELFSRGGLFILIWYLILFLLVSICFSIGKRMNGINDIKLNLSLENKWPYYLLTFLASLGVFYTWMVVLQRLSLSTVVCYVRICHFNGFKEALYSDYSLGIFSLRYLVVATASIGVCNILQKKWAFIDIFNVLLLICEASLSHRLSIIMTVMIVLVFLVSTESLKSLRLKHVLILLIGMWLTLSLLNYTRNGAHYEMLGVKNIFLMNYDQIVAYLGSAFQGGLAIGNHFESIPLPPESYRIGEIATIDGGLWAYSAFYDLIDSSMYELIFGVISILLYSFVMGFIYKYIYGYMAIIYGVLLYCFAELWRMFLFNKGIIITVVILTIICTIAGLVINRLIEKKNASIQHSIR